MEKEFKKIQQPFLKSMYQIVDVNFIRKFKIKSITQEKIKQKSVGQTIRVFIQAYAFFKDILTEQHDMLIILGEMLQKKGLWIKCEILGGPL